MRLIIENDYDSLSQWAAEHVINRINEAQPSSSHPFVLGLPTGSTPLGIYERLVKACAAGQISFRHVITFNMDEYVGLPENHPQSYHAFMHQHLFDHIDCPSENIHILNGNAQDLQAECDAYEHAIREVGGIDLFIGGLGVDGHIAFNEPGSSLLSRTRVMTLNEDTRIVNSRFFNDNPTQTPHQALTVGVATITDAREVLILCNGHHKARALQATVEGPVTQMCPASALQLHPRTIIVCDEQAVDELKVSTYRYFRSLQSC